MRKIELKSYKLGDVAGQTNLPDLLVGDTIKAIVETKSGGMSISEMRQCIKIHEAIDTATKSKNKYVHFEDADYTYLVGRVQEHRWPLASSSIIDLVDLINSAPVVEHK